MNIHDNPFTLNVYMDCIWIRIRFFPVSKEYSALLKYCKIQMNGKKTEHTFHQGSSSN
ncbi:hypothetical protein LEP1GSC060_0773 [Leptospira weilii serovar Ranarum str. ICFT]|uniref:Uncharacterized protein n=1 Tax=Leptospira weilii serovar Ranarum str. ICFT TaxID=1218598 RepID=N1WSY5_9LEPT|nr:hypothetical protein LEP1GSC060_0773 [Leptospira weilii serovar Ranarum str. ICFT]